MGDSPQMRVRGVLALPLLGAVGVASALALLSLGLVGCATLDHPRIVRDTTLIRPASPYDARVTVVSRQRTDTVTTRLSDSTLVEVTRSEKCLYQEIILRAREQFHTKPHVGYLRARDRDCQTPGAVRWEMLKLRGAIDKKRWEGSPEVRRGAKRWLTTYLSSMYAYFPDLEQLQ